MRTLMLWLIAGIWLMHASCTASGQVESPPESKSPNRPSRLLTIDIERLDPSNRADYPKIIALLRSQDIPVAQRIEYARRYIRGDSNPTFAEHSDKQLYAWVITCAVLALARLNDIDSIPLIEEKLEDWQATRQRGSISPAGVYIPVPNLEPVRVSLARLKAVRDVPEVKTSDDLIRRLRRMLHHLGFNGTIDEWLQALSKELSRTYNSEDLGTGLHEWTLRAYMGFLLEAGWRGVDIDAAAKVIQLDWQKYPMLQNKLEAVVQLAKVPRSELGRWIVEDSLHWQVFAQGESIKAQALADLGVSVVPIIQEKLQWVFRNRDKIEGTGMGLTALMEVLVTLAGEQALPFIEPYTQDSDEWVRRYACRAKKYIQQGKMFTFAPSF